ncbi:MAG: hypothetical protein E7231_07950 [Cellulosilyticum sp.]|nr:hypothetical protein [Cellulosilyticum sp.]
MFDEQGRFIINDYAKKTTFSSFLPGISGKQGIPIWCFYVNRGQGVASFGVEDKEHSIMEFYPAHQAYALVSKLGFRTFMKIDGNYYEAFAKDDTQQTMYIGMNEFEVEENNETNHIKTNALYFTLPNENLGALMRKLTVKNTDTIEKEIEIIDGMAAILPYGIGISSMKAMGQTSKAWMQVEDVEKKLPYFRVPMTMGDTADVKEIDAGHFYFCIDQRGELLPVIVDPDVVFEYDTTMNTAVGLKEATLEEMYQRKQVTRNHVPCSFFGKKVKLNAGESITFYEVIGQVAHKTVLQQFYKKCQSPAYFEMKRKENNDLTEALCKGIMTRTGDKVFDEYCKQTYLDNLLRGGYPMVLGENKIFYLYSRKHGDIERDYNFFSMLPEYYSQGNANYRDVNQNRRCDVLFNPYVKDYNVKTFFNMIQLDGYNPLSVQKTTYYVDEKGQLQLVELILSDYKAEFKELLAKPFTPGQIKMYLEKRQEALTDDKEIVFNKVFKEAKESVNAELGEGYWTDHWTYNLDLIESYLMVYPEKEHELLFRDNTYTYFESKAVINPRGKRYTLTDKGIRQYNAVDYELKQNITHKEAKTQNGKGEIFTSNLMAKIILLDVVKFTNLDPYGMGIEMEGGKPGWYDALNGLPGLLGSSMCETYELSRLLTFTIEKLKKYKEPVCMSTEMIWLMCQLEDILEEVSSIQDEEERMQTRWQKVNEAKEHYRELIQFGVKGTTQQVMYSDLIRILEALLEQVIQGIEKAKEYGDGICPTYFRYDVEEYENIDDEIQIKKVKVHKMPDFLEGPVRYLKLDASKEDKKALYEHVKASDLYDKKLKMYKVNAPLKDEPYEIGRARAFTAGWLENESIWLHMEYKYLLELLRSEMYKEFIVDFKTTGVPFLDENMYGRSLLENSSFIVSSANPDEKIHGKGYVARLSGSTAEFLHIWQLMMFGKQLFTVENENLVLRLQPCLPKYLIDDKQEVECTLLGRISVIYRVNKCADFIPGSYKITQIKVVDDAQIETVYEKDILLNEVAEKVRQGKVIRMEVNLEA